MVLPQIKPREDVPRSYQRASAVSQGWLVWNDPKTGKWFCGFELKLNNRAEKRSRWDLSEAKLKLLGGGLALSPIASFSGDIKNLLKGLGPGALHDGRYPETDLRYFISPTKKRIFLKLALRLMSSEQWQREVFEELGPHEMRTRVKIQALRRALQVKFLGSLVHDDIHKQTTLSDNPGSFRVFGLFLGVVADERVARKLSDAAIRVSWVAKDRAWRVVRGHWNKPPLARPPKDGDSIFVSFPLPETPYYLPALNMLAHEIFRRLKKQAHHLTVNP